MSPGLTVLCTSDSVSYEAVLKSWREFRKPDNVNEILGTFGPNVDTSNGDDWPRHRKIVAPCFSERSSVKVWDEALRGAEGLVEQLLEENYDREKVHVDVDVVQGMSSLALNVISAVAFENHEVNEVAKGHMLSLKEALTTVMSTAISPALEGIMAWRYASALHILMPSDIKNLMLAMREFRQYMDELIARERSKPNNSNKDKSLNLNLIQTLIKANTGDEVRLSDNELRGNIFIFTVGGLESTSATLSYALALLAIHPEVQGWVVEEIREVMKGGEMEYAKIYPRLLRVKAVMVCHLLYLSGPHYHILIRNTARNTPPLLPLPAPPPNLPPPSILHPAHLNHPHHPPSSDANHAKHMVFACITRLLPHQHILI